MSDSHTLCEQCGESVPVISGYAPWCDCGWNLDSDKLNQTFVSPFQKIYSNLGKRRGRAIFNRIRKEKIGKLGISPTKSVLILFAVGIQLTVLSFFLLGLYLVVFYYSSILLLITGLSLLGLAWVGRPRFNKIPRNSLDKENFPQLHKLVEDIAAALETEPPDHILITDEFNASVYFAGLSQHKTLSIGLSLFSILDTQEKTAVISHELAHFANGDPLRSSIISVTVNTLAWWFHILHCENIWDFRNGVIMAISEFVGNLLSLIPLFLLQIFAYFMWDESQKAEYLADKLGAQVSGTEAFVSMIAKLLLYPQVLIATQRAALNKKVGAIEEIIKEIKNFPPRQFDRVKRIAELEESRLDATHPPTIFRLKMLRENFIRNPLVILTKAEETAINQELEKLIEDINYKLTDAFERSLYQ